MLVVDKLLESADEVDKNIIDGLLNNNTIEQIAENCFFTTSAIKYRIKKIIKDSGAKNKEDVISLFKKYIYPS